MIDFPASPTNGQQFTAAGVTWVFDGTKWSASGLSVAYLPLAGGTMSGPIVLAADPAAAMQPATKQYADASINAAAYGGFVNKLRNGGFDIFQRGTLASPATGTYTADGWYSNWTGAAPSSVSRAGQLRRSGSSCLIIGVAGNTGNTLAQRIESFVAAPLAGQIATFQAVVRNQTAGAITPTLGSLYPTATDNYAGNTTDLATVNLQPVAASATTVVSYTFLVSANAINGYQIMLGLGAIGAGVSVVVSDIDLRATPGAPIGLNSNPPPPELRPLAIELVFCQRYFRQWNGTQTIGAGYIASATLAGTYFPYGGQMRTVPTISASAGGALLVNGITSTAIAVAAPGLDAAQLNSTLSGGTVNAGQTTSITGSNFIRASAEL